MNKVELRARGHGKSYAQFVEFITAVKSGKKAIVVAKDYVVIDSCAYEQLRIENEVLMEQNFDMNKSTVKLRKENEKLRKERNILRKANNNHLKTISELVELRDELRKALEWIKRNSTDFQAGAIASKTLKGEK